MNPLHCSILECINVSLNQWHVPTSRLSLSQKIFRVRSIILHSSNVCVIACGYPLYCAYPFQILAVLLSYFLSFHYSLTPPCGVSPSNQPTYLLNTIKFDPQIWMTKMTPTFSAIVRNISRSWKTNAMISGDRPKSEQVSERSILRANQGSSSQ